MCYNGSERIANTMAYGPATVEFPKPNLGDVYVRKTAGGLREEALVLSIAAYATTWKARLVCDQGNASVSSFKGTVGENDWRPKEWVWSAQAGTYHPPGLEWVVSENEESSKWKLSVAAEAALTV